MITGADEERQASATAYYTPEEPLIMGTVLLTSLLYVILLFCHSGTKDCSRSVRWLGLILVLLRRFSSVGKHTTFYLG
jgi:hypothetical protein